MIQTIVTKKAPAPGNYSQAKVVDLGEYLMLYTAGQAGNEPQTGEMVHGGIIEQTKQTILNLKAILAEVNGTLSDIVKVTVFMREMTKNKSEFETVYVKMMSSPLPARSLVEVSLLPLPTENTLVMIEAIAYIKKLD